MNDHGLDDAQRALLQRVLTGELPRTDPTVVAAATEPWFRAALDELLAVQVLLDQTAATDRQLQAATTAAQATAADEALVTAAIRRLAKGEPARAIAAPRPSWRWPLLLGAAALLLTYLFWPHRAEIGHDDDRTLGQDRLQLLAPIGDARTGLTLRWRPLPDHTFAVTIYDPNGPANSPTLDLAETRDTQWALDADQLRQLQAMGPGLAWRVEARDRSGGVSRESAPLPSSPR